MARLSVLRPGMANRSRSRCGKPAPHVGLRTDGGDRERTKTCRTRHGGRHEGARVPRPRPAILGFRARPDDHRSDRRDRAHRLVDDLRHRPAHPQGRRPRGDSRGRSSATRPSAPSSRSAPPSRRSRPATACSSRASASCGRCRFCKEGHYGLCTGGGGWIFGHLIDGLQAELARVPFADTSVYKVPEGLSDEQVLFLADILPTAYEVGVLNGRVEPGDTVAVVGAGPVGLAAIMTAKLHTPARSSRSTSPTRGSRRRASSARTSRSTTAARTPSRG